MNVERNSIQETKQAMCKSCKTFYASEHFDGFCSGCFKKNQNNKKEETQIKQSEVKTSPVLPSAEQQIQKVEEISVKPEQKDRKRCYDCKKKVGLLGIECKCGFVYCNKHRLPEDHDCDYDHKEAGKKKLQKQVIKVYNGKIAQI